MSGIQGRPTSVRLEKHTSQKDLRDFQYVTVQPIGSSRNALDAMVMGAFIRTSDAVVENGSNDNIIVLTGHGCKKGDVVRLKTTSNSIDEFEVTIDRIVDANSFELSAVLSASLTAGDTIDLLRPITQQFSATGSQVVTVTPAPVSYILDGLEVEVEEDTVTPANNKALPVKVVDFGGDISLTANNLNVQLSHTGANPDSVQLGDGTNLAGVTASNELKVIDSALGTKVDTVNTNLGTLEDDVEAGNVLLTSLDGKDFATAANQVLEIAELQDIEADIEAGNALLTTIDADTGGILTNTGAIDTKLGSTNALLATIDADTGGILTSIQGIESDIDSNLQLHDVSYNSGTMKHSLLAGVRQDSLASNSSTDGDVQNLKTTSLGELYTRDNTVSSRLPSAVGQNNMANSLSVAIASNQTSIPTTEAGKTVVTFHRHDYSSNVTTAAWTQLIASIPSTVTHIEIFDSSGQTLKLGIGPAASEVDLVQVFPGGNGMIPVQIASGSRIAIKAISANATEGEFCINLYGSI